MSGTGSLTIGALRTPMDYKKAVQTQDELLRIAIANDLNISEARKLYQQGETLLPTPQDLKTPSELQADESYQEQTAITNLLKLFQYREIGQIIANLTADEKFIMNASFPEIEQDIKKRFNPKLITPQFFIDYMRRYVEELNASKGVNSNLAFIKNKFDDLTANIQDIKANIPTVSQMRSIALQMTKKYKRIPMSMRKPIYDRVIEMQKALPDEELYKAIDNESENTRFRYLEKIQNLTSNFPTREDVEDIIRLVEMGEMSEEEGILKLQDMVSNVTDQQLLELQDLKTKITRVSSGKKPLYNKMYILPINIKNISSLSIGRNNKNQEGVYLDFKDGNSYKVDRIILSQLNTDPEFMNYYYLKTGTRKIGSVKALKNLILNLGKNVGGIEMGEAEFGLKPEDIKETTGSGIPSYKIASNGRFMGQKITSGIDLEPEPTYKTFGKYVVHIPQLKHRDLLNVKFRSLGRVPQYKQTAISSIFKDFMLDLLENGKANHHIYEKVPVEERKLFERIATDAGIINGLGLKTKTLSEEDIKDNERFELLRAEYLAGNNSATLLKELRKLVVKFMNSGKISKSTGTDLLIEFSV